MFYISSGGGVFASSTLQATGAAHFYGSTSVDGALTVSGLTTLGSASTTNLSISGAQWVGGLSTTTNGTINTQTAYQIAGTQVLSSTTLGSTVLNSSLTSLGTLGSVSVSGLSSLTGGASSTNVSLSGALWVDGLSTTTNGVVNTQTAYQVAGTQVLSGTTLGSTVTGSSLTSVGTITSGGWQGTAVGAAYGGTGLTSYAAGDILYSSSVNPAALSRLAKGGEGTVLKISGGEPVWGVDLTSGGGSGSSPFSTSTDNLAIIENTVSQVVVVGSTATTSTGFIFEVGGLGSVAGGGHALIPYASTTMLSATTASSTNLFVSGGVTLPSASLSDSALSSNVALLNRASQTYSALNIFGAGASTSLLSSIGGIFVGQTSTSTIVGDGNVSTLNSQLLVTGSTTLQNFTASNSTTTNATTTNLAVTGTLNAANIVTTGGGSFTSLTDSGALTVTGLSSLNGGASTTNFSVANNLWVGGLSTTTAGIVNTQSKYQIAGADILSATTLGSTVVNSSLTSLGTLTSLITSGLATFNGGASTTNLSVFGTSYFGGTASTTINSAGLLTSPNMLVTGSSTIQNLSVANSTTTNATTTNLAVTGTLNAANIVTTGGGSFTSLTDSGALTVTGLSSLNGGASTTNFSVANNLWVGGLSTTTAGIVNTQSKYQIAGADILSATTLGSTVVNSSLTSLGTLTSLTDSGTLSVTGLSTLGNASTTMISASGGFFVNGNATTSANGNIATQGTLTVVGSSALGTISSGLWNGTAIGATYGGTGQTGYAAGDILYADTSTSLTRLAKGSDGTVLKLLGGVPTWGVDQTSGGGGGSSPFATSTDNLAIIENTTSQVLVLGATATSSTGFIFEVGGTGVNGKKALIPYASTTMITATTASTTNLILSSAVGSGTRCLQVNADGTVTANSSACGSGSGVFSFTPAINYGVNTNSTSTIMNFTAGIQASSTSQIAYASTTGMTVSGTASTSALIVSNSITLPGSSIADAALSSNVSLLNRISQTFTALNIFNAGASTTNLSASGAVWVGGLSTTTGGTVNTQTAYQIAGTQVLSGTTLGSNVVNSSLTSLGTLSSLAVSGQTTLGRASSTVESTLDGFFVGRTSTTTILGDGATSTFSGGIQATALNITTTTASSTFANGINLTKGCFAINGVCVGAGGGSQTPWTSNINGGGFSLTGVLNASTTNLSVFGTSYFGGTATTTINSVGDLFVVGSTTLQNFTANNSTTTNSMFTNATTTNMAVTGTASTSALTVSNGFFQGGLADCSNTSTSKLLYNATTGKFTCGVDQSGSSGAPNIAFSTSSVAVSTPINTFTEIASTTVTLLSSSNNVSLNATVVPDYTLSGSGGTVAFAMSVRRGASCAAGVQIGATTTAQINSKGSGNPATDVATIMAMDTPGTTSATVYRVCAYPTSAGTVTANTTDGFQMTAMETKVGGSTSTGVRVATFATSSSPTVLTTTIAEVMSPTTSPSIIPSSTSNRIWITGNISINSTSTTADSQYDFGIYRGTGVCTGQVVGTTTIGVSDKIYENVGFNFVDSPASTASQSYTICGMISGSGTNVSNLALVKQIQMTLTEVAAAGADLAELYGTSDPSVEPGDVVSIDDSLPYGVKKSAGANDANVIGVVSTKPGLLLDDGNLGDSAKTVPVALSGRIPVKVSTENGSIKSGDLLTPSSIPGVAMKAIKAGLVIGQAMNSYSKEGVGQVLAFVKNAYYSGGSIESFIKKDNSTVLTDQNIGMTLLSKFMTDKSLLNSTSTISSEILADRIGAGLEMVTPKVLADQIVTRSINSFDGKDIGINLIADNISGSTTLGNFVINALDHSSSSPRELFTLDSLGNAKFAGKVTADSVSAKSITGLEIVTDQISAINNQVASFASSTTETLNKISTGDVKMMNLNVLGSLVSDGSLIVNGSAKFNSDVEITGKLTANVINATEINTPGLTMLASTTDSLMTTSDILSSTTAAMLSRIGTLENKPVLDPNSLITLESGLTVNNLTVLNGGLKVESLGSISGASIELLNDVTFIGRPYLNSDSAGHALISKGAKSVRINFDREYLDTPVVNATPVLVTTDDSTTDEQIFDGGLNFVIAKENTKGFTLLLDKPAVNDINFNWTAFAVKSPKTFKSEAVSQAASPSLIAPVTTNTNADSPSSTPEMVAPVPLIPLTSTSSQSEATTTPTEAPLVPEQTAAPVLITPDVVPDQAATDSTSVQPVTESVVPVDTAVISQ